ncbi:MAG: hypothetical protein HY738_00010 [Bacteroidia bacterium]|nr:hypothetical protein [Bacteroidia bacterium]
MELRPIFALVGGIINLFLAILVIYKNRHNAVHRIFFILSIDLSLFNFSLFFSYPTQENLLFKRIVYMFASLMPALGYHFFITLLNKNNSIYKKIAISGYIAGFAFLIAVFTPVFVVYNHIWINLFMAIMFPYAIYGVFLLYKTYRSKDQPMERLRLIYLMCGALAIISVGALDLIFKNLLLSCVASTFYSILAAFAIIKHRLLDITSLGHKIITVLIMSFLFSVIFLVVVILIGRPFNTLYFSILISTILIIIIYQPLKNKVINFIEQYVFTNQFAYQHPIYEFSHNMNYLVEENILTEKLISVIGENMNFDNVGIWTLENGTYLLKKSFQPINYKQIINENSDIILTVKKYNFLLKDKLDHFLQYEYLTEEQYNLLKSAIATLDELKLESIFPVILNNAFMGFIGTGRKKNTELISSFDIKLLQMLADQYASCLKNIHLQLELFKHKEIILLGKLASGIAHEIKNPIGAIKGAAQYLHGELKDNNLDTEFADIIAQEADRLNELTTEFLLYARPPKLEKKDTDINSVLKQILKLIIKEDRFKNIILYQNFENNLPIIKADASQLKQVFYNLIINAGQAAGENGVVEINTGLKAGNLFITVKDNGDGISPEILPNIFDPFFTTKVKGSGLGLSIAKQIISGHNGKINVESKPGDTRFTVLLYQAG